MLDVLTSYMALYFSDVMGVSKGRIPFLVGAFTAAGLVSDLLVVYLLERFDGRSVLRFSAAALVVLYPAWLLAPGLGLKIGLALVVHFMTLGWYTIHKGEAFAAAPARKGTMLALDSAAGLFGGVLPWLVGWTAGMAGLPAAMWILLLGPVGNLLLLPKPRR
jgi:FSR family fosmidomycin resistance protein-like MFS transporter